MYQEAISKTIEFNLIVLNRSLESYLKQGYTEESLVIRDTKFRIEQLEKGELN